MEKPVYFVYTDPDTGQYYYYENTTGATTFDRPTEAWLLDPKQPDREFDFGAEPEPAPAPAPEPEPEPAPAVAFAEEPEKKVRMSRREGASQGMPQAQRRRSTMTNPGAGKQALVIDVSKRVREFREAPVGRAVAARDESFFPNPRERALPRDLKSEIQEFQVEEVAHRFFRDHRKPGLFSRQKVDFEALASFQAEPLKAPLLQTHTKNSAKAAIDAFRLILAYTGADPKDKTKPGGALTANKLVSQAFTIAEVRDEIFFQLVKQTRGNPNRDVLLRTWELFLVVATIIPATRDSEQWIKAHLYQSTSDPDKRVAEIAEFTYIRFNTRFVIGKPMADFALPMIQQIPKEIDGGHRAFGASIYEQLWNQRKTFPNAPVPVVLHQIAEALITKGCEQWEGLFRLPGSHDRITRMQKTINEGGDPLDLADMNDLASLFKSWFAKLPEPIVNADMLPSLKTAWETKAYIDFVGELPDSYVAVLKYLIGFLKKIATAVEATKMTPKNLAICFAPNLVDTDSITDPRQISQYADMSQDFIITLIETWEIDDFYPPEPDLMAASS
jgi:hypothetical protein